MEDIDISELHSFMNNVVTGDMYRFCILIQILSLPLYEYKEHLCLYVFVYHLNFTFQIISVSSGFSLCHFKLLLSSGTLIFSDLFGIIYET